MYYYYLSISSLHLRGQVGTDLAPSVKGRWFESRSGQVKD